MVNVLFSVLSRAIVILSQVVIIMLMIRLYGELTTGYFSYASAIASVLFMCCTFTLTKLVAVRYRNRSVTYFFSIFLVGGVVSFILYIFSYFIFIKDEPFLVFSTFLIKLLDYSNEFYMVYYRRVGKEVLLFKKQVFRFLSVIVVFGIVNLLDISASVSLTLLSAFYFAFLIFDCCLFRPSFKVVCSGKPFIYYIKMIRLSWKNSLNGLLSTFSTNSPKFACAYFLGMEVVAIYTILSYVYTVFCTFVSILIQAFVIKIKDYDSDWRKFEIKTIVFVISSVLFVSFVNFYCGYNLFSFVVDLSIGEESYIVVTSLLLLTTIPLSIRDLESYLFIKKGFIAYINLSTIISLVSFWLAISIPGLLSLSQLCFYLLLSNCVGMTILVCSRFYKVKVK